MTQQINLFNPAFRRRESHFSAATMVTALVAMAAGCTAIYFVQKYQNGVLERSLAQTNRQLEQRREQMVSLSKELSARGSDKGIAEQLTRAEQRLEGRRALLEEVRSGAGGSTAGFSPYLAALARRTMPGVWLTGVEVGKSNELVLKGRVLQSELMPVYIGLLKQEEPFAGRSVSELRLTARSEAPQGVQPPSAAPDEMAQGPRSFVEFFMSIPL
jgi:hypothetical protein